jgi:hypothetical protein
MLAVVSPGNLGPEYFRGIAAVIEASTRGPQTPQRSPKRCDATA